MACPAPCSPIECVLRRRVFCYSYPQCWSLDTGNWHGFGECWLKWQADPKNPLYGQRGRFSDEFRKKHWYALAGSVLYQFEEPSSDGVSGAGLSLMLPLADIVVEKTTRKSVSARGVPASRTTKGKRRCGGGCGLLALMMSRLHWLGLSRG